MRRVGAILAVAHRTSNGRLLAFNAVGSGITNIEIVGVIRSSDPHFQLKPLAELMAAGNAAVDELFSIYPETLEKPPPPGGLTAWGRRPTNRREIPLWRG